MDKNIPDQEQSFASVGQEILCAARNQLVLQLPFLDAALCALAFSPEKGVTPTLATDGQNLYYDGMWLGEQFLRSPIRTNRAYMHVLLHCMLRHLAKKRGRVEQLWDLACDAAVESILDELDYSCLDEGFVPAKQHFYSQCRQEMPVLTAEGIYRLLRRENLPPYELARLQRVFLVDDHSLWAPERQDSQQQIHQQDLAWKDLSEKTATGMQTILSGKAAGGKTMLEQLQVAVREDVDYRAFLRRFAAPREVMAVDGDAFDYIFYTYGLRLYGNMPLVEPPETREEKRIEDFVIAIDTSLSTSGDLVRQFLACTYAVLRSTETFTRRVNIRILQCDNQIRQDTHIRHLDDLKEYMDHFELYGGSSTDFRPVFDYVQELCRQGAFSNLRGLLYFTDGMGTFPTRRPPYETAFILLKEPPLPVRIPSWAIRLVLDTPDLDRAVSESADWLEEELDLEDLPRT